MLVLIIYLNISLIGDLKNLTGFLRDTNATHNISSSLPRIALIYHNHDFFTSRLAQGAKESAKNEGIYLKIYKIEHSDQLNINNYLQLSLLAEFDGIIIDGENPDIIPLIKKASAEGIPVVTILSDLPDSGRISYVGTDNHREGYIIGRTMLKEMLEFKPNLAIISIELDYKDYTPAAEYLKIFGFKEAISSVNDARIITWQETKPTMLKALNTIDKILKKYPEVNGIFTTHPITTVAAANVIQNYPDRQLTLFGYGNNQEIQHFLNEGILKASVYIDPYKIGSNAVKEITTYLKEKKVNLYSNINIQLYRGKK